MLACLAGSARAAVTFTVTPSTVSNTYSGSITLLVSNVPTGDTVVVQKFLDLNTNGVIDGSDWLVQQFKLTDGQAGMVIGGVTNFNVPGDLNATTGAITATLNFQNGNLMQKIVGKYLFKLSSPAGHFTPITNLFTVTNFPFGQKFTGNVVSNGTSTVVSNAVVVLFPGPVGQSDAQAGTVANNAGTYTIQVPAGTYSLVAFRSNYLGNFSTAPLLTLGNLATITTNLTVTNATSSISGRIVDAANPGTGLPGIFLPMISTNGMAAVGFSDTNGNFTVGVRSGQWRCQPDETGLILHGYVELIHSTNINAGNTTFTNFVPRANALVYGSVKDTLGNPMAGIDVYFGDGDAMNLYETDGYTDTNGNYVAGVLGGLGTNQVWFPEIPTDHNNGNPTNYLFTVSQLNGSLATNTAVLQNFTGMLATNHISGSVKTSSTNTVGVGVGAGQDISGAHFWNWTHTDTNGNYVLNVGNGTWDVNVYCSASGYGDDLDSILGAGNYVCPNDQYPTINNSNATNNFVVQGCSGISIWSGTWVGTYNYMNAYCGYANPGTVTLILSVSNGVVSGSGIDYDKLCYDTNTCEIYGKGTLSGPLTGTVSGNTITLIGSNWVDSCIGGTYTTGFGGTLNGCTITGWPSLFLQKQVIENGGFETGDFTGWTLSGDTSNTFVDVGFFSGITPHSGSYEAVLGTSVSLGYLSQTLPTTAGASYLLSFWFANPFADPGEFLVSWNGNTLLDVTNPAASGWTNIQFTVTATGTSTVLQFGFQDNYDFFSLDDVSVVSAVQSQSPGITGISLSGTNLVINGSNGLSGRTYYVLMTTNLTLSLSQWTPVATNVLNASGNFTITATNAVDSKAPHRFYILKMQ